MTATVVNFNGFETGGLEELDTSGGTPTVDDSGTNQVRSGTFSVAIGSGDRIDHEADWSTGVNDDYILGFGIYFTDTTPASETVFCEVREGGSNWVFQMYLEGDGDMRIEYPQDATQDTATTPFGDATWHWVEIAFSRHDTTGYVTVYVDGDQITSRTSIDTTTGGNLDNPLFFQSGLDTGTAYLDDIYTAESSTLGTGDFLGTGVNIPRAYQNTVEDATDQGSTLDTGTWAVAGEVPVSDETPDTDAAEYSAATASGTTLCDTADSNARPGPSGGPSIGTIEAGKWFGRFERGNGQASTHTFIYGHNGDVDQSDTLTLGGTPSNHYHVASASAAYVPTTSETFSHGFSKSGGGREIYCHELMAFLLTVDGGVTTNQTHTGSFSETGVLYRQANKMLDDPSFSNTGALLNQINKLISPPYFIKNLNTQAGANLITYWPLNEASGSNADNLEGTAARDGTYSGVTLGVNNSPDGLPAGYWNGSTSYCDIYSASLDAALDPTNGLVFAFAKVRDKSVWTDDTSRVIIELRADANNYVEIKKGDSGDSNQLKWTYVAGGTTETYTKAVTTTQWFMVGMFFSDSTDLNQMQPYYQGAKEGFQSQSGTWSGSLNSSNTVVGALSTTPAEVWDGYISHLSIRTGTQITDDEAAYLALTHSTGGGAELSNRINKSFSGAIDFIGTSLNEFVAGVIEQTHTGAILAAGALIKQVNTIKTGSILSTGALLDSIRKTFTGSIQKTGALVKQVQKTFTGSINFSGALETFLTKIISVVGSISATGALIRQINIIRVGDIAPLGALIKQIQKAFTGSIDFVGALTNALSRSVIAVGSILPTGNVNNRINKLLAGSIDFIGTLNTGSIRSVIATGSILATGVVYKVIQKILTGSIDFASVLYNQINKLFSASIDFAGALTNVLTKVIALAGSLSPIGALTRQTNKLLTAAIDFAGALSTRNIRSVLVTASILATGALYKVIQKTFAGSMDFAGDLTNLLTKVISLAGSISPIGNLSNTVNKILAGSISATGVLRKQTNKIISGSISATGNLRRQINKIISGSMDFIGTSLNELVEGVIERTFTGAIAITGAINNQINKTFIGSTDFAGALSNILTKVITLAGSISPTGALSRQANKLLAASIDFAGDLNKQINKAFTGSISLVGALVKSIQLSFTGDISPTGALSNLLTKIISVAGSLLPTGALNNTVQKIFSSSLSESGNLIKQINKVIAGSISSAGALIKRIEKILTGNTLFTGTLITGIIRSITPVGELSATGALSSIINKIFSSSISSGGELLRQANIIIVGSISKTGTVIKEVAQSFAGSILATGALANSKIAAGALRLKAMFKGMFKGLFKGMQQ